MYPVITISREFGSGGHDIGKAVAEKLGIPFYDSAIMQKVAEESGYAKEFINVHGEYTTGVDKWFVANVFSMNYYGSPQDQIFAIQSNIILDCAKKGPCVIVGRCADYILEKEDMDTFNIFVHADRESRKARVIAREKNVPEDVDKFLEKKNKGRKSYYRYYTDRSWGDYKNYQLDLDSGFLGEDTCVDLIVTAVKKKYGK